MSYTIVTRPIQSSVISTRGRRKNELPAEIADAVAKAVVNREVETVIGVSDLAEGKKLLSTIKARVREGQFGEALSARGSIVESTTGVVLVVFSMIDYKPHTKPHVRKPKAVAEQPAKSQRVSRKSVKA